MLYIVELGSSGANDNHCSGARIPSMLPKSYELFDDFFFNFAANRKLQMKRIVFPLPVVNGSDTTFVPKKRWKMEHFFMHQDFYTLIFDNLRQMNVVKDTTIGHVVVERINLPRRHAWRRRPGLRLHHLLALRGIAHRGPDTV